MISIMTKTIKMTDLSVASVCPLGVSVVSRGTSVSGNFAGLPVIPAVLPVRERDERPTEAPEAAGAAAQAQAYAFAATGAGIQQQTTKHDHKMWAFRGLEPWSDPL